MKPTFYFCNPTAHRHQAQEIRLRIEAETNIDLISPFYEADGTPTEEIRQLDNGEATTIDQYQIVDRDLELIDNSDGIVAYVTNRTSWGSIQECYHAARVCRRPTYIIFDPATRGACSHCGVSNPNNIAHPWAKRNSAKLFESVEEFIAFAKEKYGPAA